MLDERRIGSQCFGSYPTVDIGASGHSKGITVGEIIDSNDTGTRGGWLWGAFISCWLAVESHKPVDDGPTIPLLLHS